MYYFVSDIHLGLGSREESLRREKLFVQWLREVGRDAKAIFIVGDMFDFWHEYKRVGPKGFSRLLGALSELTDQGLEIHFFPGNHDMWAYGYLRDECGVIMHRKPAEMELYGKRCYITHGDDISARGSGFWTKFMNGVFRSGIVRWLFSKLVPPNQAIRLGSAWSVFSRKSGTAIAQFRGERDPMVKFSRKYLETGHADYFIFGHNHCAEIYPLNDSHAPEAVGQPAECAAEISGGSADKYAAGASGKYNKSADRLSGKSAAVNNPADRLSGKSVAVNNPADGLSGRSAAVFLGEWINSPTCAILGPDGRIKIRRVGIDS